MGVLLLICLIIYINLGWWLGNLCYDDWSPDRDLTWNHFNTLCGKRRALGSLIAGILWPVLLVVIILLAIYGVAEVIYLHLVKPCVEFVVEVWDDLIGER